MSVVTLQESRSPGERYRAIFDARWFASDDRLFELRRAALERFVAAGFPTQRQEEWKYTNLRRLEARTFAPAATAAVSAHDPRWIANAGTRIVLVNGHCMPTLSSLEPQLPGMTLLALKRWSENDPAAVATFIAQASRAQTSALEDLNLAFFEDGVVLDLAAGANPDQPIYIVHHWSDAAAQVMSNPRVAVRAGANSRCVVIEHFVGAPAGECFTNAVCDIESHVDRRQKREDDVARGAREGRPDPAHAIVDDERERADRRDCEGDADQPLHDRLGRVGTRQPLHARLHRL
jgi:Fe-S cluster assembly protein SufD